jgi:hypothetical protein
MPLLPHALQHAAHVVAQRSTTQWLTTQHLKCSAHMSLALYSGQVCACLQARQSPQPPRCAPCSVPMQTGNHSSRLSQQSAPYVSFSEQQQRQKHSSLARSPAALSTPIPLVASAVPKQLLISSCLLPCLLMHAWPASAPAQAVQVNMLHITTQAVTALLCCRRCCCGTSCLSYSDSLPKKSGLTLHMHGLDGLCLVV